MFDEDTDCQYPEPCKSHLPSQNAIAKCCNAKLVDPYCFEEDSYCD